MINKIKKNRQDSEEENEEKDKIMTVIFLPFLLKAVELKSRLQVNKVLLTNDFKLTGRLRDNCRKFIDESTLIELRIRRFESPCKIVRF